MSFLARVLSISLPFSSNTFSFKGSKEKKPSVSPDIMPAVKIKQIDKPAYAKHLKNAGSLDYKIVRVIRDILEYLGCIRGCEVYSKSLQLIIALQQLRHSMNHILHIKTLMYLLHSLYYIVNKLSKFARYCLFELNL